MINKEHSVYFRLLSEKIHNYFKQFIGQLKISFQSVSNLSRITNILILGVAMTIEKHTIDLAHLGMGDLEQVGGKNASLGEMISQLSDAGVRVPGGFATTANANRDFLAHHGLAQRIAAILEAGAA